MAKGPSPLIPLLLVAGLGLLLRGNSFPLNLNLPSASEAESAIFMCVLLVPFVVLLAVYSATHTVVLPLLLAFVTYTVSTMLLGPLMLILIVYVAGKYLSSFKCNDEELGWGCMLLLVFFLLQWVSLDEGRQSGALVVAIVIFACFHFRS
ncbi:hypothetical protein PHJA_000079500 [Phtheirospermum japonicum]|uniref:Uncharacterized protein n=1 Tax=Phtheirospermum japonicum TaxID=374723 RepID=A0A830AXG5_9LAMI|nr:hypothetical protein PHJA_000079500 [Phtheirospermum japonicum]